MLASSLRRASTAPDVGSNVVANTPKRPSVADVSRKASLGGLSLRLKPKRSRSGSSTPAYHESRLGQLFFSLPGEIQTQILQYFELEDVFSLRLSSQATIHVLHENAFATTKSILARSLPNEFHDYIQHLYPLPIPCISTDHLLQMLHRQRIVEGIIRVILDFVQMKIYMIRAGGRQGKFSAYRDRLEEHLYPAAWTIHHFLETYRQLVVLTHPQHVQSRFWECTQCGSALKELVASYPRSDVLPAFHFYQLLILQLRAASRAPTYAGTIERALRGWSRKPPSEEDLAQLVILGGLDQLSRLSVMKGTYNQRLEIIGNFIDSVSKRVTLPKLTLAASTKIGVIAGEKGQGKDCRTNIMKALDTPFEQLSEQILENIPTLENFFVPEWLARINNEGLMDGNEEAMNPFIYIQEIMIGDAAAAAEEVAQVDAAVAAAAAAAPLPNLALPHWRPYIPTNYG